MNAPQDPLRAALERALNQWEMYADTERGPGPEDLTVVEGGNREYLTWLRNGTDPEAQEYQRCLSLLAALPAEPQPPIEVERLRRIEEAARLVSQWHNSIGSGPIEELNAELGDLWDLTHDGEPPERRKPAATEPAPELIAAVEALPGVMGDEAHVERDEVVALLRRAEPADGLNVQTLADAITGSAAHRWVPFGQTAYMLAEVIAAKYAALRAEPVGPAAGEPEG